MKYRDKHTLRQIEKQLDRDDSSSHGAERRKRERELKKFSIKICEVVDRIWWNSLTLSDRERAHRDWSYYEMDCLIYQRTKPDFKSWAINFKNNNKPDTALYRENRITDLLS